MRRSDSPPSPSKGPARPRGRFVSQTIAVNEQLAGVSLPADFLFRAILPFLDVEGRMAGNPLVIKGTALPLRTEIDAGLIPDLLRELARATDHSGEPLVVWYEINGTKVLECPGFSRQQRGLRKDREAPSKFPPRNGKELLLHKSGAIRQQLLQDAGAGRVEVEVEVVGEVEVEGVHTAEHAHATWADGVSVAAELAASEATLRTVMGEDRWKGVSAFLCRRPPEERLGWMRQMITNVGPGSEYTVADLDRVCQDDEIAPIKSPFGMRRFLATARAERLNNGAARNGGARNDAVLQAYLEKHEPGGTGNGE